MTLIPKVKLKTLISFPASVLDGVGIDVVKQNGTYQFNLDFSDFAPPVGGIANPAHANALLWDDTTGQYSLVPASVIASGGAAVPSNTNPIMDGVAAPGIVTTYARGDHVHPTDTSRAAASALPSPATATPIVEGVGAVGTSLNYAREDHVHPAGGGGGGGMLSAPQGRPTLTSGTPVMQTSVASANQIFYTPYGGNQLPLWNGSAMVPTVFPELSQLTTDATKSPAAVAPLKVYDLFVWNDAGTIRCTRGPAWATAISRGYTLTALNGFLLNTSAIANGPGALRGTYIGTVASNAGSTIDYIFGTSGAGGVAGVFNVWSAYNRVDVGCMVVDTGAAYTYASGTVRQARASAGMQVSFVVGAAEDAVTANYANISTIVASATTFSTTGLGFDSTTIYNAKTFFQPGVASTLTGSSGSYGVWNPGIGAHFVAALEASNGVDANTFNSGGTGSIDGLSFRLRM